MYSTKRKERTQLPHLQNGNNDGCLHGQGAHEMTIISISDLLPESPHGKESPTHNDLGQRFPNLGNRQNHLGSLKNTGSCPPFQTQREESPVENPRSTSSSSFLPNGSDHHQGLGGTAVPCPADLHPTLYETLHSAAPAFTHSEKYTCLRKQPEPLREQRAAKTFQNKE